MMLHEQRLAFATTRATYTLTPCERDDDHSLPTVAFSVSVGIVHLQDYFTPEEAEGLADLLRDVARLAREANPSEVTA